MRTVSLLDATLGIQSVMEPPGGASLPAAQSMASTVLRPQGVESLYVPANVRTLTEKALHPAVGDGALLQPEVFGACLRHCAEELRAMPGPAARELLEKEVQPLLNNSKLLQAYTGLMLGG